MTLAHGVVQRRAAPAVADVHVAAALDQLGKNVQVARGGGQVHARPLIVVGGVDGAFAVEEDLDGGEVALARERTERVGRHVLVEPELSVVPDQHLGELQVAFADRVGQRRPAPPVLHVDVAPVLNQGHRNQQIAGRRGQVEARALVVVGGVDVAAGLEEQVHVLELAAPRELAELTRSGNVVEQIPRVVLQQLTRDLEMGVANCLRDGRVLPSVA
mmetsp:Transcript_9503/g.20420  ORF Transcript_9503/g.20420 Transcript_9503/m.20420 type:complete len:216 (-) Transcript_9503:1185-1832(-)